ncbi:CBASS oligonucleotide cyclase [Haliangium sp.]|uniref:CBASS oligonucleotide cyclase n=1 Tax=Haliangium sp. TaxID=2663208 RepID=UPI003D0C1E76
MPRSLANAFDQFVRDIEPTQNQHREAKRQKKHLRESLDGRLKLERVLIMGSYARHTAIRPLHDVDIFIVLNEHVHGTLRSQPPSACLNQILAALQDAYPGKKVSMRPQRRSVGIDFSQSGIGYDVVPAFERQPGEYLIPDTDRKSWIKTNPERHAELCKQANQRAGGGLNRLIKAAKHWNGAHGKNLASFHLEVMSYDAFRSPPESLPEGLATLFGHLTKRIQDGCPDPAGVGPNIDKGLTQEQRTQLASQLHNVADKLARAIDLERQGADGSVRQAHQIFYKLLGSPYPPP